MTDRKTFTMNRLTKLLSLKNSKLRCVFYTAGYPTLDDTVGLAIALEKNGVDILEIGMPFSDPVADGPVIQDTSMQALSNGMNLYVLLEQIKEIRLVSDVPIVLMGYVNPIIQYGWDSFLEDAARVGVDGLIVPDLPFEVFTRELQQSFSKYNISFNPLVTEFTSIERLKAFDEVCTGYIYAVSGKGVTGSSAAFKSEKVAYFKKLQCSDLKHPVLVGFGISSREAVKEVDEYLNGVIVGTHFLKQLRRDIDKQLAVQQFTKEIF